MGCCKAKKRRGKGREERNRGFRVSSCCCRCTFVFGSFVLHALLLWKRGTYSCFAFYSRQIQSPSRNHTFHTLVCKGETIHHQTIGRPGQRRPTFTRFQPLPPLLCIRHARASPRLLGAGLGKPTVELEHPHPPTHPCKKRNGRMPAQVIRAVQEVGVAGGDETLAVRASSSWC